MLDAANNPRLTQSDLHLTCFVIASPEAREHLDRECIFGNGLDEPAAGGNRRHDPDASLSKTTASITTTRRSRCPALAACSAVRFFLVDNRERADAEIVAAARYIDNVIAPHARRCSVIRTATSTIICVAIIFRNLQNVHGMRAAFGDGAEPIHDKSDRWNLPRYICGHHWKSQDELRAILSAR